MIRPLSAITLFVLCAQLLGPALAGDKSNDGIRPQGLEAMRSELRQEALRNEQVLFASSIEALQLNQVRARVAAQDREVDQRTVAVSSEATGNNAPLRLESRSAPFARRTAKEFDMPYFSFSREVTPSRSPQP